jgi:hypothetical protein
VSDIGHYINTLLRESSKGAPVIVAFEQLHDSNELVARSIHYSQSFMAAFQISLDEFCLGVLAHGLLK